MFNNHRQLFTTAFFLFVGLTVVVAVLPAIYNQENNRPLPGAKALSEAARQGKLVYIANGCVGCHTQQVRNIAMDRPWGDRPGIPADYATIRRTDAWRNTATLMGTERTGPDLTNIGNRQPARDWHLVHLYNPRTVVAASIMPAYPWLFTVKDSAAPGDIVVNVPAAFRYGETGTVVAGPEALQLVAYLQELKQLPLPGSTPASPFLYAAAEKKADAGGSVDGKALFTTNCQTCHQANGEGLPGAFPPLKGSSIVNGDDLQLYVDIIMHGYDARPEFGAMPPVGTNMNFTEKEVTALINYERSSWGNNGKPVTEEEVKKVLSFIQLKTGTK
ncbi:cytochrome c [Paraflavitalea pollutisoli]|uniref:cytochrome c n=1 Tax=Paraflavitalea pollutisoli TaxID=3034143 RepID=UPI0023EAE359|nr:cbb3-type cytochrome c oxidase subunit II [Paraflavitalea sp. H1-2-19X]